MKYIAYLRVSTQKQRKSGLGLEGQRAILEHYTKDGIILSEFIEVGSAKAIENRPQLKQAIEMAKKEKACLIVAKLDRLSRDVEHIFRLKKELGTLLMSCDLPSTDSLTLSIFAGLAQRERELVSIRTKFALAQKKKQGVKLGKVENFTNVGRRKGQERNRIKATNNINNKRATELIVLYRNKGFTLQEIANRLNDNGFKTAKDKLFQKTTVLRLYKRATLLKL